MPVAAACGAAVVEAAIALKSVGVVAVLDAGLDVSIAALRRRAIAQAGIGLHFVGVITGFETSLAFSEVLTHDSIPTASRLAAISAGIMRHEVVVITDLNAVMDDSITATRSAAIIQAGVSL